MNIIQTPSPRRTRAFQQGFTLIELMVTLALAAVLAFLAAPSFRSTIATSKLTSRANDLVGTLAMARSESIRRGTRITVCKSSDQTTCATTGDWEQGWIVFVDTTRSTSAAVDTGEAITSAAQSPGGETVIKGSTDVASYVSFAADGRAKLMNGSSQTGTLRICNPSSALPDTKRARDVEIIPVGRIITKTPSSVADTCPAP